MVSKHLPMDIKIVIILIFGGHVKAVSESLYTLFIIWVITIPNHIDTRTIFPRYEGSYMLYRSE